MDPETLKKANDLAQQIKFLESELSGFENKSSCVHLQMMDHYGNKGPVLKLYAFGTDGSVAMGSADDKMREEFDTFLAKCVAIINRRIKDLKKELKSL